MQKRGLSTIVVTLILILVSLVAIGIVWVVVRNLINAEKEEISIEQFTLSVKVISVRLDTVSNEIHIKIKRNAGQGEVDGFEFLFRNWTDVESHTVNSTMHELEEVVFTFHLEMNVSQVTKITIVPFVKSSHEKILLNEIDYILFEGSLIPSETKTFQNLSDGFSTLPAGSDFPMGLALDTRDNSFWIMDFMDIFTYHLNSSGVNQSDGFSQALGGAGYSMDIEFDQRDNSFWIVDSTDYVVYHFNSSGANQSDGFRVRSAGVMRLRGIALDTRDNSFWILDYWHNFVYHLNSSGANQSDGFPITCGASYLWSMAFDPRDNSFWLADDGDAFVYHLSSSGANLSDGFKTDLSGGSNDPFGITFDSTDNSFWVTDYTDDFVYHFGLQ